jgi:putative phosphoesterase
MATRIAVLGDIHGNAAALDAVMAAVERERPDHLAITGDLVLNGPRPGEVVDRVRRLDLAGAYVVQGNTDVAVADFDYAAAFPWLVAAAYDGSDPIPPAHRAAAEWAHDQLSDEQLAYLRRLPAERRIHSEDAMVLVCHGSPGSQTQGLSQDGDSGTLSERLARTDASVVACGHTHVAEVFRVGRKLIVNAGSCGYAFDEDASAAWALITIDGTEADAEIRRVEYDAAGVAAELATRGVLGDVYRAATIRTGVLRR